MNESYLHPRLHFDVRLLLGNDKFSRQFATQKNDVDRLDCAYRILKKLNLFTPFFKDDKNDSLAREYRLNGDREFEKGSYRQALDCYTQSVTGAKTDVVLALGYGNRSASLYKLSLYKECIQDIDRACACNYPVELKEELIIRRTAAEGLLKPMEPFYDTTPTIPNDEKNPHIQCARNCVKIESNKKFGRHVVATRDIQIGEIMSVEQPYVCALNSQKLVHCHHCMELCYNPLPCDNCTQALYCSEECRATALDTYHKYECPIYFIMANCMGSAILVLRIAMLVKKIEDHALEFDSTNEYYRSDRYKEIHHLKQLSSEQSLNDSISRSVLAAVFFQLVESRTTFFQSGNPKNDFKEILMRYMRSIQIDAYRIHEDHADSMNFFADGLYSFSSLFNHSCCHNTDIVCYGTTLVMKAINTIKRGQQCYINYGPRYRTKSKQDRHELLKRNYYFTCQCRACKEDWKPENINGEISWRGKTVEEKRKEARELLPLCIQHLKFCEKLEPFGLALAFKTMTSKCFYCLGNQRQF